MYVQTTWKVNSASDDPFKESLNISVSSVKISVII